MSEDESMVVMASCVVALGTWIRWYWCALAVHKLISSPVVLRILLVLPIVCLAVITIILKQYASFDVRDSGTYMFFYVAMGMAWIGLFLSMPIWGVSIRDDALERRNPAAAITIVGLMLGLTLAFAGGNIGDGPGWWVVVFASGLATINLLLFWWLLNQMAAAVEHVTIDRDRASGVRSAAYLIGCGLISGMRRRWRLDFRRRDTGRLRFCGVAVRGAAGDCRSAGTHDEADTRDAASDIHSVRCVAGHGDSGGRGGERCSLGLVVMMHSAPYRLTECMSREALSALRRRAIFECDKWDPQVGDQSALASSALLLDPAAWLELETLAQSLAEESLQAEREIALRPELHAPLGLSRPVRRALRMARREGVPASAARVMRFDFHWTHEGWRHLGSEFRRSRRIHRSFGRYSTDGPLSRRTADDGRSHRCLCDGDPGSRR